MRKSSITKIDYGKGKP